MMEIRLEAKTLAIGVLLGAVITILLGADNIRDRATGRLITASTLVENAERTDYALTIPQSGVALVRTQNGDFFIVNPTSGMAVRVLHARRLSDDPTRNNRDYRGKQFNYSVGVPIEEEQGGGNYGK
jgi:hypothetical protein